MGGVTAVEVYKDGTRKVYHRAGTITHDGVKFEGRYSWVHPADKKTCAACVACTKGLIPADIKAGKPGYS